MTSTVVLARALASAVHADGPFMLAARDAYQKPWTIEVGFDGRRTDWSRIAPFALFTPSGAMEHGEETRRAHMVGLLLGVVDQAFTPGDVPYQSGLAFLADLAWPLAWDAMQRAFAVDNAACSLRDVELEYSAESSPLLFVHASITINETLPIGGRRS